MEDSNVSTFNEASFKMKRLHELQETCNMMRLNPYAISKKTHKLCFVTHFDSLISLYQEISSKLTEEEKNGKKDKEGGIKKDLKDLKSNVKKLLSAFEGDVYGGVKMKATEENKKLKEKVEEGIFDCEETIRFLLDKHGFSTMNMENDEGDPYN